MKRKNPSTESSSNNKLRNCTIEKEPTSEKDATTILALNDDCLFAIFKYLGVLDLSSIADTCTSFKQCAKAYFVYSKKTNLDLDHEIFSGGDTYERVTSKTSRVMRHFGEFIVGFSEGGMGRRCMSLDASSSRIYQRKIIELLVRYCSQSLRELELSNFMQADVNAHAMEPLIARLHKLSLVCCDIESTFWNRWSLCCSQLHELRLHNITVASKQFECLHGPFPKLVKIELHHINHLRGSDIVKMLEHNPQLKEIDVLHHGELISFDDLLPSIAAHVPEIESLHLRLPKDTIRTSIHQYFGQLRKLSALTLEHPNMNEYYVSLSIREIVSNDIPLKHLSVLRVHFNKENARIFENVVSQLKQLETLKLVAITGYIKLPRIHRICQRCTELSTLLLCVKFVPKLEDISQIVRNLKNLRSLSIEPFVHGQAKQICVETDVYKEWLQIVESRSEKTHLAIELYDVHYSTNVPNDLTTAHQKSLSVAYTKSKHYAD